MKILITGWYILRSIALRGPINSFLMLKDDQLHERRFGIRTAAFKESGSSDFFHYQGASYRVLFRIFKSLPSHNRDFTFFDIGCGKGRAVYVAENSGFNTCVGIELDNELITDAINNLTHYRLKRPESTFQFECANALDYEYKKDKTVYFLFNPFSEAVLRRVLKKIVTSAKSETWFVYMNPKFPAPFFEENIPLQAKLKTRWYTEALIFCLKKT